MAKPFRRLDVSELAAELNDVLANVAFVASNGFSVSSQNFNAIGVLREYESNAERGDLLMHLQLNAVADDTPQDLIDGVHDAIRDAATAENPAMQDAARRTEHILSQTYKMSDLPLIEVKLIFCSTYDSNQVAGMTEHGWACFRDIDAAGTYRLAAQVRAGITAVHCAEESLAEVLNGDDGVPSVDGMKTSIGTIHHELAATSRGHVLLSLDVTVHAVCNESVLRVRVEVSECQKLEGKSWKVDLRRQHRTDRHYRGQLVLHDVGLDDVRSAKWQFSISAR